MPRHVDHEARRRDIAEAVCALIAERGIEAVTLRDVAARADVSMGAVQRAFPKDGMLRFALEHVVAEATLDGRRRVDEAGETSARRLLEISLREMALTADDRGAAARVWLTFVAQAGVQPDYAEVLRKYHVQALDLLIWLIEYGRGTGEIRADADAAEEARMLEVLADGVTVRLVLGHLDTAEAERMLDLGLRRLWV